MRYYRLEINNTDGSPFAVFTSQVNGANDPGALQVEFDIQVTTLAEPIAANIKLWGVSLQQIGQATDYNGKLLKLFAGMAKGLPLANPSQAGLILQGVIFQAFGNWISTDQWVEFVVVTNGAGLGEDLNISFNWTKGQKLADAIAQTLSVAAPSYQQDINISDQLVLPCDEPGYFNTLTQFAQYLKAVTQPIIGGDYTGVDVMVTENTFRVFDGTSSSSPRQISYLDLVGQPTWIDPATIQVALVMRADLQPTDYVQMPPTQVTTTAPSQSQYRDKSVFQGAFLISEVRHLGNFRQPDALSWITTLNCTPQTTSAVPAAA